ncbi:MAG: hypothetical protein JWP63_6182, partial [Candidatus Solibacter sp.]|nr:hypothetical protein [Candidatus Solibacter sp.]
EPLLGTTSFYHHKGATDSRLIKNSLSIILSAAPLLSATAAFAGSFVGPTSNYYVSNGSTM